MWGWHLINIVYVTVQYHLQHGRLTDQDVYICCVLPVDRVASSNGIVRSDLWQSTSPPLALTMEWQSEEYNCSSCSAGSSIEANILNLTSSKSIVNMEMLQILLNSLHHVDQSWMHRCRNFLAIWPARKLVQDCWWGSLLVGGSGAILPWEYFKVRDGLSHLKALFTTYVCISGLLITIE